MEVIAFEDIPEGTPVKIKSFPYVSLVCGEEDVAFISNQAHKKNDVLFIKIIDGKMIDITRLETDNPKTWPIFSPANRRFWVWIRSLIYGFVRKIEDVYDLEPPLCVHCGEPIKRK